MSAKSILLVDDDFNLRYSLMLILERAGYLVAAAGRACEALDCLQAGVYDLAIIDLGMPDEGLSLLPEVFRRYPLLRILILTAHLSPATGLECELLRGHDYLVKPVNPECFLEHVEKLATSGLAGRT